MDGAGHGPAVPAFDPLFEAEHDTGDGASGLAVAAVAVTASRGDDLVDEANSAGFHVYASKPIATSDLIGIVVALGRPTLEDELAPGIKMTQP